MAAELRMVRMRLDAARLFELARRRRLPARAHDLGYIVHCQLKELFGDDAPAPFSLLEGTGRWLTVLAYTRRPAEELLEHARSYADPAAVSGCDLTTLVDKTMPEWPAGKTLGFEVKACPIVRLSNDVQLPEGTTMTKGAEVDAFLARCWRTPGVVDREAVYREWLGSEVERRGGIKLLASRIVALSRSGLVRRTHGDERRSRIADRPDVTFSGEAQVIDGGTFTELLARGIGRHRAFGFGMVLLRPPRHEC